MSLRIVKGFAAASVSALLLAGLAGTATAADPVDVVKERQQGMKKLGGGMQAISKFLKNEGPTAADAATAADTIAAVAKMDAKAVFPQGTAAGVGESAAKPELWTNWASAEAKWGDFQKASVQLAAAAKGGDKAQIGQALQATSKTCGSCHEDFRIKKN